MIIPDRRQKITRVTPPSNVTKLSQLENDTGFLTPETLQQTEVAHMASTAVQPRNLPAVTPASIGAATAAQGAKADTALQVMPTITPSSIGAATAAQGAKADTAMQTMPTITPASIGAATAAQGVKADTAVQPGQLGKVATTNLYSDLTGRPALTHASLGAASAAQGAKADSAVQPAAIANFVTASQIPAAAQVYDITVGTGGLATFTFPTPYTAAPKVLPIELWVGEQMYVAGVTAITATTVSVIAKRSRGTLLLTNGPFETAPSGSKVQIAVLP